MQFLSRLTSSTDRQATYSDGPSSLAWGLPWGSVTISRAEGHSVEFDDLSGTLCAGGYDLAFTTGGVGQEEVTKRMMAHALLFMMPPNGLDEAVEPSAPTSWSLTEALERRVGFRYEASPAVGPVKQGEILGPIWEHRPGIPPTEHPADLEVSITSFLHALVIVMTPDCDLVWDFNERFPDDDSKNALTPQAADADSNSWAASAHRVRSSASSSGADAATSHRSRA